MGPVELGLLRESASGVYVLSIRSFQTFQRPHSDEGEKRAIFPPLTLA